MTRTELKERVDEILSSNDDEAQHSNEDKLHLEVIDEFCPEWVKQEIRRLSDGDFARWCA